MRLSWQGVGRIIEGDYILEWELCPENKYGPECMYYFIHSLRTGKGILEILVFSHTQPSLRLGGAHNGEKISSGSSSSSSDVKL